MHGLHYNCEWSAIPIPGTSETEVFKRRGLDLAETLAAKGEMSIYCGSYLGGYRHPPFPDGMIYTMDGIVLNIYIYFKPWFWPSEFIRDFGFQMRRDKEGNVQWLPLGKARPALGKPW